MCKSMGAPVRTTLVCLQHSEQMEQDLWCLHLFNLNKSALAEQGSLRDTSEAINSLPGTSALLLPSSNSVYSSNCK